MSVASGKKVAVLGLGIIGSRSLERLKDAGWNAVGWNRTPKGTEGEAASAEEAIAGASIISIYLKDAPTVRSVVGKFAARLRKDQILLNHATVDLETTRWLADVCEEQGCRFLDAPFTGSKMASQTGQLVYYIGGDKALKEEVADYLAVTSKSLLPCGDIGTATVVKLGTNLISACVVEALAEGLAIAVRHGVPAEAFAEAVSINAHASGLTAMKLPAMTSGNFEPHFSLANMWKDSRYALALADDAGLETPAIEAVSSRMGELCELGMADLDFSALAKPYLHDS